MRIKRQAQADVLVVDAYGEMESRFIAKISDVKNIICITHKKVFINHRQYRTYLNLHVPSHQELLLSCTDVAAVPLSALC
jgi:nucleoside-triphosphatase THEP1